MNRQPKITRREQQDFIRDEAIKMLHYAVRACPCDGVGCDTCKGKMKYFDNPVPIRGIITSGMNTRKKEAQFPSIKQGSYKLLVEPRFRVTAGDMVIPFGIREFEQIDEIISVSDPNLTFIPITPNGIKISFIAPDGVLNYKYPSDFTVSREFYGRVPLFSKKIRWIVSPPNDQEKFSVRYGYLPDFEVEEIPPANMSQGQKLIQELSLKKITIGGQEKSNSYEESRDAIRGLEYV